LFTANSVLRQWSINVTITDSFAAIDVNQRQIPLVVSCDISVTWYPPCKEQQIASYPPNSDICFHNCTNIHLIRVTL